MKLPALPAALLVFALLPGCAGNDAELAALDERVSKLEQAAAVESSDSTVRSRELQEVLQVEDVGESVERIDAESDLIAVATAVLPNDSLFAELDPEFGGISLTGDRDLISITMVRSGLDDQPFVASLLETLQFPSSSISAFESQELSGDAVSRTGLHQLEWISEGDRIVVQIWALGPGVETE